jgi:hypothetical protein
MPPRAKGRKGPSKRYPLNMRTTREMRERLERAAKAEGRSLVQEVEFLIEKALLYDDLSFFLGAAPVRTAQLLKLIVDCITFAEINPRNQPQKEWPDNPELAERISETIAIVTAAVMTGKNVTPLTDYPKALRSAMNEEGGLESPSWHAAWAILLHCGLLLKPESPGSSA